MKEVSRKLQKARQEPSRPEHRGSQGTSRGDALHPKAAVARGWSPTAKSASSSVLVGNACRQASLRPPAAEFQGWEKRLQSMIS